MSVVHRVVRRMTDDGDPGAAPDRQRRRSTLAAAAASALLCGVAACGVQPTGVHVTAGGPITLDPSSPTSTSSGPNAGQYTFFLFLWKGKSTSIVTPVMRTADHDLSPMELLDALGYVNEDEVSDGYATSSPRAQRAPGADQAAAPVPDHGAAEQRRRDPDGLHLDLYWSLHPDPNPKINASTEITGPGITPSGTTAAPNPASWRRRRRPRRAWWPNPGSRAPLPSRRRWHRRTWHRPTRGPRSRSRTRRLRRPEGGGGAGALGRRGRVGGTTGW